MSEAARIVIADDEAEGRETLARALGERGYEVKTCGNGKTCAEAAEGGGVDLALLAGTSGLELLERLRRRWSADALPVILVTADVVKGLEAGANDCVSKPIDLAVLMARIGASLRMKCLATHGARERERLNAALAAEVKERKRIEQKLRVSGEQFEKAFRASPDGLALSHRETGELIDVNDQFARMFGYAREEVIGRLSSELGLIAHPPDRERAIAQLRATGVMRDFEAPARRRTGEIFPVSVSAESLELDGRSCVLTITRDITERERVRAAMRTANEELENRVAARTADLRAANEALRESERRFRTLADNATVLMWMDGPDGMCQFVNKSWLDFTGRRLEQELGLGWLEGIHAEDRERCHKTFEDARQKRRPLATEYRLRRHDGVYRWMLDTSVPRFRASGEFIGCMGSCFDITDRRDSEDKLRQANNALRESEERFRTMADNAPMLLWMTGEDGLCSFVNKSWLEFTGRRLEQELADGWRIGLHPDDREGRMALWRRVLPAREQIAGEYRIRRADGVYRWLYSVGVPRFGPDGSFAGYIGSCMDITERREAEQVLRQTADELERRVSQRTEELAQSNAKLKAEVAERKAANQQLLEYQSKLRALSAQVALAEEHERRRIARGLHDEIGQSLALVKMRLGAIRELANDAEKLKNFEEIRAALETAIMHIRSLTFDLGSRILYEFGLEAAIENLVEEMQKHGMATYFSDDRQPKLLDEEVRVIVFQAVRELLHNVSKHAGANHVSVSLAREDGCLRVEVKDDGKGFDPRRAGQGLSNAEGFGLFNLREQLDYIGGAVELESSESRGTRVTIVAPLAQEAVRQKLGRANQKGGH